MNLEKTSQHIISWLIDYSENAKLDGFIIGVSGGVDSALTATLCAKTKKKVILLNMPIRQKSTEYERSKKQIKHLESNFDNVKGIEVNLSSSFQKLKEDLPDQTSSDELAMANTRARLRMTTLYAIGQANRLLVTGTGNKVEDFGVGFFTKYGDGGVDLSPIADLMKSEVFKLAAHLNVISEILSAKPTDGLWEDGRNDEDQIGATYDELEWAMEFDSDESVLSSRELEVLEIYKKLHNINKHKIEPIPVCKIPNKFKD